MNKYCKDITKYTFSNDVRQICQPLRLIGINGFFYIRRFPCGDFVNLSTNPTVNTIFFQKFYDLKYNPEDIAQHILMQEKVIFSEFNMQSEIWQEAKNYFDLGSAILISKKGDDFFETFCFCLDKNMNHSGEFFLNHRHFLEQFIRYFQDKAKNIIKKAEQDKFIMPEFYLQTNQEEQNDINCKYDAKAFMDIMFSSGIDLGVQLGYGKITKKEAECLYWLCEGKTAEEISIILRNSPRTIESHISKIKEKLNCTKLTKLTEKIHQMNLKCLLDYWR